MFSFPSPTNSRLLLVGWLDDRKFVYCVLFFFSSFHYLTFPTLNSIPFIPSSCAINLSHTCLHLSSCTTIKHLCLPVQSFPSFFFLLYFLCPFFSHFFCCYFVITSTDQEKKNVTTESKRQTESLLFLRTKSRR